MALPVTFVAGDVLEAAQLNSNFTYLDGKTWTPKQLLQVLQQLKPTAK
jgi:hypothetical protein